MTASVLPLTYPKNVAPASDGKAIEAALHEAAEKFGHQALAKSLVEAPRAADLKAA
jgi:hypothetical protein